jgi:hypothetical protein
MLPPGPVAAWAAAGPGQRPRPGRGPGYATSFRFHPEILENPMPAPGRRALTGLLAAGALLTSLTACQPAGPAVAAQSGIPQPPAALSVSPAPPPPAGAAVAAATAAVTAARRLAPAGRTFGP